MTKRLFHVTEFAQSRFLSPQSQRTATHPLVLLVLVAAWLAGAGNLPLWFGLLRAPQPAPAGAFMLALGLGWLLWLACCAGLCLLAWRRLFKPALLLLLLLASLNTHLLLRQGTHLDAAALQSAWQASWPQARAFLDWPFAATVLVLGLLPGLLVWRWPLRRRTAATALWQNGALLLLCGALLWGSWQFGPAALRDLARRQAAQLTPLNTLLPLLRRP